jgi:hypothetical protein
MNRSENGLLPINPGHPLTPSLSPSVGERVPVGRVWGGMGAMRELVRGNLSPNLSPPGDERGSTRRHIGVQSANWLLAISP